MHKHPKNAPGKYFVIYQFCLAHEVCTHCASSNFTIDCDDDWAGAHVYKQPTSPEEEQHCKEALEGCPVMAIRDDGETNLSITYWEDSMAL